MSAKWKSDISAASLRTNQNYEHNKDDSQKLHNCILNGQGTEPICHLRYGKHELHHCGCEIVAVYNVMKMLHMPQDLAQMICEFEMNKFTLLFSSAVFGSSPKKLRRYFDAHGVGYEYYTDRQHFYDNASRSAYGIVSFWINTYSKHPINRFTSGLHTVAYTLDKQSGSISVYNRYNGDTEPRSYKDVSELLSDRRFIAGYLFPNN